MHVHVRGRLPIARTLNRICVLARSESTLIVTPTRVITTAFANDRPTIGIEGLFQNFEKPEFPKSSIDDSVASSDDSIKGKIQPTSVRR